MQIQFLTDEGLNDKYYQWKDIIVHTILKPALTITDDRHSFEVFGAFATDELLKKYSKEELHKIDKNYNRLIATGAVLLIQLVKDTDIQLAEQAGYMHPAILSVFKDDLIKASPITLLGFQAIDHNILLKEKYN